MNTHITRCALALALATGAIASHTATAAAATSVKVSNNLLSVKASPGVANYVMIWVYEDTVVVLDHGDAVTPGEGCKQSTENGVICPKDDIRLARVTLGDRNDVFLDDGSPASLIVLGEDGDDVIEGSKHVDSLYGGAGKDRLDGYYGSDLLDGGASDDVLDGGPGDGDAGYDGGDTLVGGPGVDQANYSYHRTRVVISLNGGFDDGTPGERDSVGSDVEDVRGTRQSDTLKGNDAANTLDGTGSEPDALYGYGGDDTLYGSWAADWMDGGSGDDLLAAKDGADDAILCGPGVDTAAIDRGIDDSIACEIFR